MTISGYPRHLSKFVKSFLSALTMRFTDRPQCFSQCFRGSYRSAEWGAALNERGQVRVFIVSNSVLPTTKYDADPFESQGSHGFMVGIAFTTLLLVVRSRPLRLCDRMTRPFVKALP